MPQTISLLLLILLIIAGVYPPLAGGNDGEIVAENDGEVLFSEKYREFELLFSNIHGILTKYREFAIISRKGCLENRIGEII